MTIPIEEWKKVFVFICLFTFVNEQLAEEEIKITNTYVQRFSIPVLIKEILIEMTKR